MRRQHFVWTYLVLALVLTIYGGYSFIYNSAKGKEVPVLGIVFLSVGGAMLLLFLVLYLISLVQKKKGKKEETKQTKAEIIEEDIPETIVEKEETPEVKRTPTYQKTRDYEYVRSSSSSYNESTVYVKKVGYGPVLRISGNRVLDMRNNTYYRIEGNNVFQEGSGPVFEINGDKIRSVFGGYLYEISGSNINKVFGGFYASISGNNITVFDLSTIYEMSDSLSKKQLLVVAALLF